MPEDRCIINTLNGHDKKKIYRIIIHLKLVTQTDRIPASSAARHATGTTSETCPITRYRLVLLYAKRMQEIHTNKKKKADTGKPSRQMLECVMTFACEHVNYVDRTIYMGKQSWITTKSALMDFSHSTSVTNIESRGITAVSEYC